MPAGHARHVADLRSNVHKHHGFGLPTQGVLQQLCKLAVAERDVCLLVCQGRHDITCKTDAGDAAAG